MINVESEERQEYLIPANSKRGMLILNMFRPIDLGIFASGAILTLLLLMVITDQSFKMVIIKLLPLLVCTFLVLPIPNYHNTRILIKEVKSFFTERRIFLWKGWCVYDDEK